MANSEEWFKGDSRFAAALSEFQQEVDEGMSAYRDRVLRELQGVETSDGSVQVYEGDGEERRRVEAYTVNSWSVAKEEDIGCGNRRTMLALYGMGGELTEGDEFTVLVFIRAEINEHIAFEHARIDVVTLVSNACLLTISHG